MKERVIVYTYIYIQTKTHEGQAAKEKINEGYPRSFSLLSRRLREEKRRRREGGRGSAVCGEIQISTERSLRRARPARNRFPSTTIEGRRVGGPSRARSMPASS